MHLIKAGAKRVRIVKPRKVYEVLPIHKRKRLQDGSIAYINLPQPPPEDKPPRRGKDKVVAKIVEHGNTEMK